MVGSNYKYRLDELKKNLRRIGQREKEKKAT